MFHLKKVSKPENPEKIVSQVITISTYFSSTKWKRGISVEGTKIYYYEAQSKEHADRLIHSINNNIKHKINFLNKQKLKV